MAIPHLPAAPDPYSGRETFEEDAWNFLGGLDDWGQAVDAAGQQVSQDKEIVGQLKQDVQSIKDAAINETTAIKDSAVSETTAIKDAAVNETQAIKNAAVNETTAIKNVAVAEITQIRDDGISDITAIKTAAVEETTAIKDEAQTALDNCLAETEKCEAETEKCETKHQQMIELLNQATANFTYATSTTQINVSLGEKTITTQPDKEFVTGMWLAVIDRTGPNIWLKGVVKSYDPVTGDMTLDVLKKSGGGTHGDWIIAQTLPLTTGSGAMTVKNMFFSSCF